MKSKIKFGGQYVTSELKVRLDEIEKCFKESIDVDEANKFCYN